MVAVLLGIKRMNKNNNSCGHEESPEGKKIRPPVGWMMRSKPRGQRIGLTSTEIVKNLH